MITNPRRTGTYWRTRENGALAFPRKTIGFPINSKRKFTGFGEVHQRLEKNLWERALRHIPHQTVSNLEFYMKKTYREPKANYFS